jgi:hypothetical protein
MDPIAKAMIRNQKATMFIRQYVVAVGGRVAVIAIGIALGLLITSI